MNIIQYSWHSDKFEDSGYKYMKVCEKCGKGPKVMIKRSHSMQKNKTTQSPNIQTKKINGKRTKICTSCLSRMNKTA